MQTIKRTWLICLLTAGSLFLTTVAHGQEITTDPASADPAGTVLTNTSPQTGFSAEIEDPEGNTAAAGADSQPGMDTTDEGDGRPQEIVLMGQNAELKAGQIAKEVVVIGGSAKINGKVLRDVVVIMGNLEVNGEIGGDTVAVLGSIKMGPQAVASRDAVAVLGSLTMARGAKVERDAVCVLGRLDVAEGAVVKGDKVNVGLPMNFPSLQWLGQWIDECLLKFRPLAPQIGWLWVLAGGYFLLSLFVAAVFPRPVQICVEALDKRPATTFFMGLLTKLLAPIVILLLTFSVIGVFVVPFICMALFIGAVIGKVAIAEWLGFRIGGHFGPGFQKPLIAFLLGAVIVTLVYLVPILGGMAFLLISVWSIGCAVTALFGGFRRELPEKPASPQPPSASREGPQPGAMTAVASSSTPEIPAFNSGFAPLQPFSGGLAASASPTPSDSGQTSTASVTPPLAQPAVPVLLSYPRAGLLERMGAAFLDVVIVGILSAFVGSFPLGFLIALAYFSGMWAWKGTTIGGVVLKLQVVRSDGTPLNFPVALVRALSAALSVIVFFLGFLWIAWDPDKQAWHDKIAGTEVIRLPRAVPLICL